MSKMIAYRAVETTVFMGSWPFSLCSSGMAGATLLPGLTMLPAAAFGQKSGHGPTRCLALSEFMLNSWASDESHNSHGLQALLIVDLISGEHDVDRVDWAETGTRIYQINGNVRIELVWLHSGKHHFDETQAIFLV